MKGYVFNPRRWNKKEIILCFILFILCAFLVIFDLQYLNFKLIAIYLILIWMSGFVAYTIKTKSSFIITIVLSLFLVLFAESRLFHIKSNSSLRDYIWYGSDHNNCRVLVYSIFSRSYGKDLKKYTIHSNRDDYEKCLSTTIFYRGELQSILTAELDEREKAIFGIVDQFQGKSRSDTESGKEDGDASRD